MKTWDDDYTDAYNAVSGMMRGGTTRDKMILTAFIMTVFKRIVEFVLTNDPAAATAGVNPFDINTRFGLDATMEDHVAFSETPGFFP